MKNKILVVFGALVVASCSTNDSKNLEDTSFKAKSRIAMQRVKDTDPLTKQDLVSREAMQYAMLDKMNVREERQRREFNRIQEQQREDFLKVQQETTDKFDALTEKFANSSEVFVELATDSNSLITKSTKDLTNRAIALDKRFQMVAENIEENTKMQSEFFDGMRYAYESKLAFEQERLAREKERESTIRGVIDNMYEDRQKAIEQFYVMSKEEMLPPNQWIALQDAPVEIHVENEKFEDLMLRALTRASVHSGPWQLKWKLKKENEILLMTKFSLDAEVPFGDFISEVKNYILNYNGVSLNFKLFKEKRVLIVSDT